MTSLREHVPIRRLAEILHAAMALGGDLWRQDRHDQSPPAQADELTGDLLALFELLRARSIAYLVVGGVALLRYVQGRNTDDIDLIIAVESLAKLPELEVRDQTLQTARGQYRLLRVDLLFTRDPIFKLAQERHRTSHRFAEIDVPCATVEGLILLKLYALPALYREGDLQRAALYENDILMLMQQHRPEIGPLMEAIRPHRTEAEFAELRRIVSEIEERIARMSRRGGG